MADSPFPGMDPYLEAPSIWNDLHSRLNNVLAEKLAPQLAPKYIAELDTHIVIDRLEDDDVQSRTAIPDVSVTRPSGSVLTGSAPVALAPTEPTRIRLPLPYEVRILSLYIRRQRNKKRVTAIEVLSPINKRPGAERRKYLEKREAYLEEHIHLVEIDLLRSYARMPVEGELPPCNYLILVSDAYERPDAEAWPIQLRQALPVIPVPLLRPDPPVMLDIGLALRTAYERARYDLRINYSEPADPPLPPEDAAWVAQLLGQQRNGQVRH